MTQQTWFDVNGNPIVLDITKKYSTRDTFTLPYIVKKNGTFYSINNIISTEKEEKPKININDNSPLGWLEDNAKIERKRDDLFSKENKSKDIFGNLENKKEDIKVDNNDELNKKNNIFNDRNLEISGIQGNFNRRRPFQSIKF